MDFTHLSDKIWIRLDEKDIILFSNDPEFPSCLPTREQLRKRVTGIQLSCSSCSKQQIGIEPLKKAFGAESSCIIHRLPNELLLDIQDDIIILKYGSANISQHMLSVAKKIGMSGYWNDSNLIICASSQYLPIILSIIEFIQSQRAVFAFKITSSGKNLMIVS